MYIHTEPIHCQVRSALTASGALLHGMTPAVSCLAKPLAVSGTPALAWQASTAKYMYSRSVPCVLVLCASSPVCSSTRAVSGMSGLIRTKARNSACACSMIKRHAFVGQLHCGPSDCYVQFVSFPNLERCATALAVGQS